MLYQKAGRIFGPREDGNQPTIWLNSILKRRIEHSVENSRFYSEIVQEGSQKGWTSNESLRKANFPENIKENIQQDKIVFKKQCIKDDFVKIHMFRQDDTS